MATWILQVNSFYLLNSYHVNSFSDGIAVYKDHKSNSFNVIDRKGQLLKAFPGITYLKHFENGQAIYRDKSDTSGRYGVMDRSGTPVIPTRYDYIESISSNLYIASNRANGHVNNYGVISRSGQALIPLKYYLLYIDTATLNFAGSDNGRDFFLFDGKGNVIKSLAGIVRIESVLINGKWYKERDGMIIVENGNRDRKQFALLNTGFDTLVPMGKYNKLDNTNEGMVRYAIFEKRDTISSRVVVTQPFLVGFIDSTGQPVIPACWDFADHFNEVLCMVSRNGKHGYINRQGVEVIPLIYSSARTFHHGYATVPKDGKSLVIDTSGRVVLRATY